MTPNLHLNLGFGLTFDPKDTGGLGVSKRYSK